MDYSDKVVQIRIFNIMEFLLQSYVQLTEENKSLKDEINRLKGEKGRPDIKPNVPKKENDVPEQKEKKEWNKGTKNDKINIDRTVIIPVDRDNLPADAMFKGYQDRIVQNASLRTDNVMVRMEVWYSESEGRTIVAPLPEGIDGQFGSDLKALIHLLHFRCRVTQNRIHSLLTDIGIVISEGEISNILTIDHAEEFTAEKQEIFHEGMENAAFFHTDSSGARHKGVNHDIHVVCTALFTVFFIMPGRSRNIIESILDSSDTSWRSKVMITDDARQYLNLVLIQALCWVHDIRHYRKLNPLLDIHKDALTSFLREEWKYYHELDEYSHNPDRDKRDFLWKKFDRLYTSESCYAELDWRKGMTMKNKLRLLAVLDYPGIPLHNNPSEIAVREPVLKKDISHGTRSEAGRIAWENMLSLSDTCRKLDISFYAYLRDRFSGANGIPPLAQIIAEKAKTCS